FSSQALFSKAFRATDWLVCVAACPVDVAHYRDLDHACKGRFELNSNYYLNSSSIHQKDCLSRNNTLI
ncbi:hypothetical protein LCG94_10550, partial [Aeromonas salmonicida]|uniref:hypothetical protein n=1 Tax=Aeromonas salmonicida TaxID=645 RepID=UPI003BB7A9F6